MPILVPIPVFDHIAHQVHNLKISLVPILNFLFEIHIQDITDARPSYADQSNPLLVLMHPCLIRRDPGC
jgi:hypothetical protein